MRGKNTMATPRRRITFKTPNRKVRTPHTKSKIPKTPVPSRKIEKGEASESKHIEENRPHKQVKASHSDVNPDRALSAKLEKEIQHKREELLDAYKKENSFLRNLKKDVLIYKKFMGLDITEKDGGYECCQEVNGSESKRGIRFFLGQENNTFVYNLIEVENVELPDFLCEEICFDESQLHMFFFKVMESLVTKPGC
ncbi:hypothetical protein TCON_0114 [Astathelohania contejeani]|uniref:DUF5094 domain-containing protein n=1 Tax=Astathelohania contejeani TaxID=164912 RepID=A0ABQ7I2L7_9MICR|nr:hypothetical protein TCON_0114 [Thelohania contejeani]